MPEPDINSYISIMKEIKRRDQLAEGLITGKISTPFEATNLELAVLQTRLMLESIALASIAAHRELFEERRKRYSKHWNLVRIIKDVEELNPNFYPQPVKESKSPQAGVKAHLEPADPGYLTREDLIKAHGMCASLLHASNPYNGERPYARFKNLLPKWLKQVRKLLAVHKIQLLDSASRLYLVQMHSKDDGEVHFYTLDQMPP